MNWEAHLGKARQAGRQAGGPRLTEILSPARWRDKVVGSRGIGSNDSAEK